MVDSPQRAWNILDSAELLCTAEQVEQSIVAMAAQITARYYDRYPVLLPVMNGALFFAGQLISRLRFPLTIDYVHASRYGEATAGGSLTWRVEPSDSIKDRDVLVLDDILDAGETLAAIREKVMIRGARSCAIAVLTDKQHGRSKPVTADFIGLDIPDRFVFGCGLDVGGFWRNLPAIYAVKGT